MTNIDSIALIIENCYVYYVANWSDGMVTLSFKMHKGERYQSVDIPAYAWGKFEKKYPKLLEL